MIPELRGGIHGPRFYKISSDGFTITAENPAEDNYLHSQFFRRQGGGGGKLERSYTTNPKTQKPRWIELKSNDPALIQELADGLKPSTGS